MNNGAHRYLVTGAAGFVAQHFFKLLEKSTVPCEVLGLDVVKPQNVQTSLALRFETFNLLDAEAVKKCLRDFRPTRILHLASVSSVGVSWITPVESFTNNTNIFLNLLDGCRTCGTQARILSVGSSEEYGLVSQSDLPLSETKPLKPGSPYGVARVAQEQLSKVYSEGYGTDIVMTRSFNHVGPGQSDKFVIASFVRQLAKAQSQGNKVCNLRAGNVNVVRDFLDVRDVVTAYLALFEDGEMGEVYNVCSGRGRSLNEVLAILSEITGVEVVLESDVALFRPNELMAIVGSPQKIQKRTGWVPKLDFNRTLKDMVNEWGQIFE